MTVLYEIHTTLRGRKWSPIFADGDVCRKGIIAL